MDPDALEEIFPLGPVYIKQHLFHVNSKLKVCQNNKSSSQFQKQSALKNCLIYSEVSNAYADPLIGLLFQLDFYDNDYKQKHKLGFAHSVST